MKGYRPSSCDTRHRPVAGSGGHHNAPSGSIKSAEISWLPERLSIYQIFYTMELDAWTENVAEGANVTCMHTLSRQSSAAALCQSLKLLVAFYEWTFYLRFYHRQHWRNKEKFC
jgi:hypothetical protein